MRNPQKKLSFRGIAAVGLIAGCFAMPSFAFAADALTGDQEVPPVTTKATGKSSIKVASDKSVSGGVSFEGVTASAAHIHHAAPGANGPVIVPLTKATETSFSVPAGTKLSDAQYDAYKAGNLYVNVHSAAHPGGEIRVQLKP